MGVESRFVPVHGCSLVTCVPSVSVGDQDDLWREATEKKNTQFVYTGCIFFPFFKVFAAV